MNSANEGGWEMTQATTTEAATTIDLTKVTDLILRGIECWIEAGEIIANALDAEPDHIDRICEVTGLSSDIVRRFEQIGRREIYPQLLANTSDGFRKLSACPYREQKLYAENPVKLLVYKDNDTATLIVRIDALTHDQVRQVFAKNHVRDLGEQRAWIESQRKKAIEKAITETSSLQEAAFIIKGKRIIFRKGCELTASELAGLLARIS